jgi:acetylornithine/succinyldiaminopimelate/putrescine aminotransferase
MNKRDLFFKHVGQTGPLPLGLEVSRAEGMHIFDASGKKYLDLNSGISVSSLGHCHPEIVQAVQNQVAVHMHTMVYGEHIQSPQVEYAALLAKTLNNGLDTIYFTNSGSESVEVAMKLARKYTARYEIVSCSNAYHGSTIGAESLRSDISFTTHYLPAVPGIKYIDFNDESQLDKITSHTACVILEPVQAEAGIILPKHDYLKKVKERCVQVGALMILDEIQTGFGRTGYLFGHQKYNVVPDVLLIAKGMGGGMPIGGVVAPNYILRAISENPMLGHITTFGGHPVCVAAALAMLKHITTQSTVCTILEKEKLFHALLVHELIREVRSSGLMMAVELTRKKYLKHVVNYMFEHGALIDYFLFNDQSFRLAPPLIITNTQIVEASQMILKALDYAKSKYVY